MDESRATDARQRVIDYIEETGALLGMIPRLLDENDRLRAQAESALEECERTRSEVALLREETGRLRSEREELAQAVARVMGTMVDAVKEILPRLQPGAGGPDPDRRLDG
jgi:predicted nuclease with TOPRIM domain